jgi:hypothetical protein
MSRSRPRKPQGISGARGAPLVLWAGSRSTGVSTKAAPPLTPNVVAFLREMGRMAADLHWEEGHGKR